MTAIHDSVHSKETCMSYKVSSVLFCGVDWTLLSYHALRKETEPGDSSETQRAG